MALFDFFRKFSFFKGRSTEGLVADDLDFQKWIAAHRDWRRRLVSYIDGSSQEALDETVICLDNRCDLGKWIHSNGIKFYGEEQIFQHLVDDHAKFHQAAGEVVRLYKNDGVKKATRALTGEFDIRSMRVIGDLEALERQVKR